MSDPMNEIAKALASDMPRRKVFKLALGGVAASIGATLAGVVKPIVARAATEETTMVSVDPATGYFGGTVDLSAELGNTYINATNPPPISDQPLEFWFNQLRGHAYEGTSYTGDQGVASISGVSLLGINAGSYPHFIMVNYGGAQGYTPGNPTMNSTTIPVDLDPSTGFGPLTVYRADTSLAVNTTTGVYGGSVDLSAELQSLVDGALPPSDQILAFRLLGAPEGATPTNINGVATLSNVSLAGINAGIHMSGVFINYAGNNNYNGSWNVGTLVVNQAPTSLTVKPVNGRYNGTANLQATLTAYINAGYQPLVNQAIEFFLLNQATGYSLTNINGVAGLMDVSLSGIAPGVYPNGVAVNYADGGNYQAAYATNTLTIGTPHTVVPLYNQNAGFRRPYWALIRLYVANEQGQNVSSRLLKVTSVELTRAGGSAIPFAYRFSFDSQLVRGGGYQLLINTRYLELGTYTLSIQVDDDPTLYSVQFLLY